MADESATELSDKIRTLHISRRGVLAATAAAALVHRLGGRARAQEPEVIYPTPTPNPDVTQAPEQVPTSTPIPDILTLVVSPQDALVLYTDGVT